MPFLVLNDAEFLCCRTIVDLLEMRLYNFFLTLLLQCTKYYYIKRLPNSTPTVQ